MAEPIALHQLVMMNTRRKPKRTSNACIACRQSKIKCSGNQPCGNCQRRAIRCRFSDEDSKVLVSERYLSGLRNQIKQLQRANALKRSDVPQAEREISEVSTGDVGVPLELQGPDLTCSIWTSPFTLPTTVMMDPRRPSKRNWIWLAPASAWSFTARLTLMMTERLGLNSESPQVYLDGDIYPLDWDGQTTTSSSDLPSLDYALHLFNVTKLHFGQMYRFLDDELFAAQIIAFYSESRTDEVVESRMWSVQFLLILAFGKAFLSRPNGRDPPGSKYFVRAMLALPTNTTTGKDSLMIVEALALAALYLYAIDHRENAHLHVGRAVRIAQLEGLHTQLPEDEIGAGTVARCQNIWWTLYVLDRQVSFALGLPMITPEGEISTLIRAPQVMVFHLQVKLSRMLSSILATIYQTEKTQLGAFLEKTRSILQTMAGLAEEIEGMIPGKFQMETVSQETRHVALLYHQCVIIATRPLLLSILKERLERLGRAQENWQGFSALPKSLISIGIKSAVKTLDILSDESIFLEVFLPSDLEFTYAAALHLAMGNTLFLPDTATQASSRQAHQILDEMISRGNKVAGVRKCELQRLEGLFNELSERGKQDGLQVLTLEVTAEQGNNSLFEAGTPALGPDDTPKEIDAQNPSELDAMNSIGISSYEFLSIIDQIANADGAGGLDGPGWLDDDITRPFS